MDDRMYVPVLLPAEQNSWDYFPWYLVHVPKLQSLQKLKPKILFTFNRVNAVCDDSSKWILCLHSFEKRFFKKVSHVICLKWLSEKVVLIGFLVEILMCWFWHCAPFYVLSRDVWVNNEFPGVMIKVPWLLTLLELCNGMQQKNDWPRFKCFSEFGTNL